MSLPIQRSANGFTLLELLVVMAIIAIFAAVILIGTAESRTKSKIAATELELRQIHNAMELYRSDFNEYAPLGSDFCNICSFWGPGNAAWDAIPTGGPGKYNSYPYATGSWDDDVLDALDAAGYLKNRGVVEDDPWGNEFLYDKNSNGFSCRSWSPVCSRGPNEILETPHCQASNRPPVVSGDDICIFIHP